MTRFMLVFFLATFSVTNIGEAATLIRGDVGNKPLDDPGWPAGAAALFNHKGRIAWWEGPPFGGGQWHSECRGDAQALNVVLADYAKVDSKVKRVVVHDGTGRSFWIAPNREPEKLKDARIDWSFTVWQEKSWEQLKKLPADLNPIPTTDTSPSAQIDVYTAELRWGEVTVPPGIEVIDNRLEAHGFTTQDGVVLEGTLNAIPDKASLSARVLLERIKPKEQGGYDYELVQETRTDPAGHWVLKQVPPGWFRIVAQADRYVPRVLGYTRPSDEPCWQAFHAGLAPAVSVSGRVTDEMGHPLADAEVRLGNVEPASGGRYETPGDYASMTNADGRFQMNQVPEGSASVWVHKPGYIIPGLGKPITCPTTDLVFRMIHSARVVVRVQFDGKARPEGYLVQIAPVGGEKIGSYGGSGNIDLENQIKFESIPPGAYVLKGRPNPGSDREETEPLTIELKGGQSAEVTLHAK